MAKPESEGRPELDAKASGPLGPADQGAGVHNRWWLYPGYWRAYSTRRGPRDAGRRESRGAACRDEEKPAGRFAQRADNSGRPSQGEWKAVMGNNPSYFKNCGDNCPVDNVSWFDAVAYPGFRPARSLVDPWLGGASRHATPVGSTLCRVRRPRAPDRT